jgi:hypothetical protein
LKADLLRDPLRRTALAGHGGPAVVQLSQSFPRSERLIVFGVDVDGTWHEPFTDALGSRLAMTRWSEDDAEEVERLRDADDVWQLKRVRDERGGQVSVGAQCRLLARLLTHS